MATTTFIPEVWAARLLVALRTRLVYAAAGVVNTDYEGEIEAMGDTVHINSIGAITINDYTRYADLTVQELATTAQQLLIDQGKTFSFTLDDVDARQNAGDGTLAQAASDAAYELRKVADAFVAGVMSAGVDAGNQVAEATISTAGDAEDVLISLNQLLDEADVPEEGRWCVVTPAFHALMLKSTLFVPADSAGTADAIRNGFIGEAYGLRLAKSNQAPDGPGAGAGKQIIAGHPIATSYADQMVEVEGTRMERRFADLVKGLHVYGAKVTRPTALAAADLIIT